MGHRRWRRRKETRRERKKGTSLNGLAVQFNLPSIVGYTHRQWQWRVRTDSIQMLHTKAKAKVCQPPPRAREQQQNIITSYYKICKRNKSFDSIPCTHIRYSPHVETGNKTCASVQRETERKPRKNVPFSLFCCFPFFPLRGRAPCEYTINSQTMRCDCFEAIPSTRWRMEFKSHKINVMRQTEPHFTGNSTVLCRLLFPFFLRPIHSCRECTS